MLKKEVLRLIEKGEDQHIEFKSWQNARSKKDLMSVVAREVVSLANSDGGKILLGVEDDQEITGCTGYDIQTILSAIYDRTKPPIFTSIEEVEIKGKVVLVINVEKAKEMHSTSLGEVFKRLGKENRPIFPGQYHFLQITKTNSDYSNCLIMETSEGDINPLEVYKLKERLRIRDSESTLTELDDKSFLRDLGLINVIEEEIKLTVAGLLFVGSEEALSKHLPQAEVIYLHYSTSSDVEYNRRLELKTTIISTLDRLSQIIEDNNTIENIQIGLFRLEVKDYPLNVFQEALLNTLVHRDYLSNGAIIVRHYPDKLIIENPGGFPEGINKDNIITHPPVARNKLIAEILQRIKYVQRAGQGVDIIYRDMLAFGKPIPTYSIYQDAVKLTLWNGLVNRNLVTFLIHEQEQTERLFSISEIMLFYYLIENRDVTLHEAAALIQLEESETRHILSKMTERRYLERKGKKYIPSQIVYSALDKEADYIKDKAVEYIKAKSLIIEYIEKKGYITNSICRELCAYNERKVRFTFNKMVKEGLLNLMGKGRSSKYVKRTDNQPTETTN